MVDYEKEFNNLCSCYRKRQGEIKALTYSFGQYRDLVDNSVKEIKQLKDKLHRRNMQIKDLKSKISKALECYQNWLTDGITSEAVEIACDIVEKLAV